METLVKNDIVREYSQLKNKIRNAVNEGTKFIFNCMKEGKVPSFNHETMEYGLWPSAEMCQFLLNDNVLPKTCSRKIEEIIKHLTNNFNIIDKEKRIGAWYATINRTEPYYSTQTTGYCLCVLHQYNNEFLKDEEKSYISFIIECAENYIVAEQRREGFWAPRKSNDEENNTNGLNRADFFYSFYSYMGIAGKCLEANNIKEVALNRAKQYFSRYAEQIVAEYDKGEYSQLGRKPVLLSIISKLIQVLNDFSDENVLKIIGRLKLMAIEAFDDVKKLDFCSSPVTLPSLPNSVQKTFHNNTPFDTYWAMREEKFASEKLLELVNVFLDNQDSIYKCWYLDFDNKNHNNTWTTIEALLVLSDAYNLLTEELYLREMQSRDVMREKFEKYKEAAEERITTLETNSQKETKTLLSKIKNTKKRDKVLIATSVGISIFISIVCFVLFVFVVTIGLNPTLEKFIDVVIFSLVGNAIFQVIAIVIQLAMKNVKDLDDNRPNKKDSDAQ